MCNFIKNNENKTSNQLLQTNGTNWKRFEVTQNTIKKGKSES